MEATDILPSEFSVDRTRSQLTYTPHSEHNYGSLQCWAKNDIGEQRQPCITHIFPAGEFILCALDQIYTSFH